MKKIRRIFEYLSFSQFLAEEVENNTQLKHGEKKKIAEAIHIHPSHLSQIINGSRQFTNEQVYLLIDYLGLSDLEGDYLFLLFQQTQTENKKIKEKLDKKIRSIKKRSLNLSERIEKDKLLTDEEKAIFYSSWQYSAIRTFMSLGEGKTRDEICKRFNLERGDVNEILQFLLKADLCKIENDKYQHNINKTHLEKTSPYLKQHHSNWRIKSIQKKDRPNEIDLSFTGPLSISLRDFEKLREDMVKMIQNVSLTVSASEPEEIFCFNLDFFKI